MKELLIETYRDVKKRTGIDPSKPGNLKPLLVDDKAWSIYVESLANSMDSKKDREAFKIIAENTRVNLLENSMYQINPYEALALPVLRVFYPKLVAKEAVTVSPMDKPETVKAFINASFSQANSNTFANAPSFAGSAATGVSGGPSVGIATRATVSLPQASFDIINAAGGALDNTKVHLERDFIITAVTDGSSWVNCNIVPAVEGHFSSAVSLLAGDDVVTGHVDYLTGLMTVASANGLVTNARYEVTMSLEENKVNPKAKLTIDKIRLYAKDRAISAEWTVNMEQDMRALFDVSMQAEIVNILGQQIALDIDREIINSLLIGNSRLNPASHRDSFTKTPDVSYTWGEKYWHENIIPKMNKLSAQVYTDTNIAAANTVLCNPLDAAVLEDLQTFNYTGTSAINGEMGYRTATVAGGKWQVLTSSVVPQGSMLMIYKPVDEIQSVFIYAPYTPVILTPYPLGAIPSLTVMSRYATAFVRVSGVAVLSIV
jgi:hypothetical protein